MNIACVLDRNYLQHCAIMLKTLRKANPEEKLNVYILHDGIYTKDSYRFIDFAISFVDTLSFIQIDNERIKHFPVSRHISLTSYFRLFLPLVLPAQMNRVLFLDADMVINRNISGLWLTDLQGKSLGAVVGPNSDRDSKRLKLSSDLAYFNAGVMLIDLELWRTKNILEESIKFVNDYTERILFWDQDVLNHIFNNDWLSLDPEWNDLSFLKHIGDKDLDLNDMNYLESSAHKEPSIIHFAGGGEYKPWHYKCKNPYKHKYLDELKGTPWENKKLEGIPTINKRIRMGVKKVYKYIFLLKSRILH